MKMNGTDIVSAAAGSEIVLRERSAAVFQERTERLLQKVKLQCIDALKILSAVLVLWDILSVFVEVIQVENGAVLSKEPHTARQLD